MEPSRSPTRSPKVLMYLDVPAARSLYSDRQSTFTFALVTGQSVTDVSQNVFANLEWNEIRLSTPVFEGDTIYSQSEVLEKRESRSRGNVGIVTVKTTGYNQEGKVVITFNRTIMVYKKGHAPEIARLIPEEG